MNMWHKLFHANRPVAFRNAEPLDWEQLPTLSAIARLDADAFSRAPAILHGMLGLREVLSEAAKTVFSDATADELEELTVQKCQCLASVDVSAGLAGNRLDPAIQSLGRDRSVELIDCNFEGLGIAALYASTFPQAWGECHLVVDVNLTKEHWHRLFALVPKQIDAPARMALGQAANGRYVVTVLHREMVAAHNLVKPHGGPSFNDFCTGAAAQMKKEKVPFDVVPLG